MELGNKLKTLRNNAGFTQKKIAEEIGMSLRMYIKYEMNQAMPSIEILLKIAKIYGVTVDQLLTQQEEFIIQAYEENGRKGAKEAAKLIDGVVGLFAGGHLSETDRDAALQSIQEAYWIAKAENKSKYTPKKYRKETSQ